MTTRTFVFLAGFMAATAVVARAQAEQPPVPAAAPQPAPPGTPRPTSQPLLVPPAPEPRRSGQAVNVKVDVTITEQRGTAAPTKKTVTIVVADGMFGAIRSQSDVFEVANQMPLNIDAEPTVIPGGPDAGKVRLKINVQYDLPSPLETQPGSRPPRGTVMKTQLHDNLSLVLESGKPVIAAQSVDPVGDRRVTVEVTATVLR
jgi:hypothetical protein